MVAVDPKAFALDRTATCHCHFARIGAHHDRLLGAASNVSIALELFELALTWEELDYSGEAVIPPVDWLEFAAQHSWDDPELVRRLFTAARDIVFTRATLARRPTRDHRVHHHKEKTQ